MEQRYKAALEIIARFCETEDIYISAKLIKHICEVALEKESGDEDVCA